MSFSSDYFELRKKKKKDEEKKVSGNSFSDKYSEAKQSSEEKDDIAPVSKNILLSDHTSNVVDAKSPLDLYESFQEIERQKAMQKSESDKEKLSQAMAEFTSKFPSSFKWKEKGDSPSGSNTWFQSGSFHDGYQFGDVTKAILGTAGDTGVQVVKGISRTGEGLGDLLAYGVAGVADLFGGDSFAYDVKENAKASFTDELFGDTDKYFDQYSVLGDKSGMIGEGLGQLATIWATGSLGAAGGLGTAGTTALTMGQTGLSSMGSGMSEAYSSGASDEEAFTYGLISGTAEAATEMLFGGLGKSINAVGLSKGLSSADDLLAKKVASKFSNQIAKNLTEFGIKAGAEGTEEVLSGIAQAVGKKVTYMSESELSDILRDENLLDQFVIGTVTSGFAQSGIIPGTKTGSLAEANKTGRDFITGLSKNEQQVVDKIYEDRVAEAEKKGEVSKKDKSEIYDKVLDDLEKGYLDTDKIEEVLGGKTYEDYKATLESEDSVLKEFESLYEGDELKRQTEDFLKDSKRYEAKDLLSKEVYEQVKDGKLGESYHERARRSESFTADLSQYDTKYHATIQNAINSGTLNNTRRTHELVDMVAKISADKGVLFDFTNNEKIKGTSFAVDGKIVNGYVTESGDITLNVESPKYLNTTVGHEITHVLEGTEFYNTLQETIFEYAKSKNDYNDRLASLRELYKGVKGYEGVDGFNKIKNELTADLVGDYLFTDSDFVHKLSTEHRNIFQKIYDEITYLCKVATAGSKEARQLEKVKKAFEEAYRGDGKAKGDTKYSLNIKHTDGTVEELADARSLTNEQAVSYLSQAKSGKLQWDTYIPVRKDTPQVIIDTLAQVKENVENRSLVMQVRKAQQSMTTAKSGRRADKYGSNTRGHALSEEQIVEIVNNLDNPSTVIYQTNRQDKNGNPLPNNVAVFVEYNNNGTEGVAVIEFDSSINPESIGTEFGDTSYHTVVTVFEPDVERNGIEFDYAEELLSNPDNIELEIKRKQPEGSAIGKNHPNTSNELLSFDASVPQNGENVKYSVSEYTAEEKKAHNKAVLDHFGKTYKWAETGYVLLDGTKLDLSGKHDGAPGGYRTVDHRDITDALGSDYGGDSYSGSLVQFMSEGNIRISPESDGINLSVKPTKAQEQALSDFISRARGEVLLDIDDFNGYTVVSVEYPRGTHSSKVLNDIREWFDNGKEPQVSNVSQFRYSLSEDTEGRQLSKEQSEYFKYSKIRDANGSLMVMYHGTPNGDYTVFKDGTYFTPNKEYADKYQNPGASSLSTKQTASNPKTYEVYLDIKKPFDISDAEARRIYIEDYIKGGNAIGINPYLSDAEYAKINTIDWTEGEDLRDFLVENDYGYDGLILDEGATGGYGDEVKSRGKSYVVFRPEQVKNVDNKTPTSDPDIRHSLSDIGEQPRKFGNYNVSGKDVMLETAPVQETAPVIEKPVSESVAPVTEVTDMFPDNAQNLDSLLAEQSNIRNALEYAASQNDIDTVNRLLPEYESVSEKVKEMQDADNQRLASLDDADIPPEMDAPYYGEPQESVTPDDPFADRDWYEVGNQKVKSYMDENPTVKPFFQDEARAILMELSDTTKGERWYNDQLYYESGGEKGFGGVKRHTSDSIAELLDSWGMSYADIEKGLNEIIEDSPKKSAAAKKIEFMLNDRLLHGYKDYYTNRMVSPNQEYINLLNQIQTVEYSPESFDNLVAHADEYAPFVEDIAPVVEAPVAEKPVKEAYEAIKPKQSKEPRMARATPEEQARDSRTAKILFDQKQTPKQKSAWKWAREHIFSRGAVFEDMSLKTGNRELQAKFDNIRRAESRAQTFMGKGKGNAKALVDVRKMVEESGKTEDFNYYLYHLHNVDRMTLEQRFKDVPNKSVFGDSVDAETSRKAALGLEVLNPEFKQWAEDVYAINRHLRQMMVDEGVISQETADLWQTMYPHYVPISRADAKGLNVNVPLDTKRTGINAPIKKATGGNSDFYNVFDTMGSRIEQTYKAIAKNRFGVELMNTLGTAYESDVADIDTVLDTMDQHEELLQEGKNGESPSFTVFRNGERVKFAITEDMYDAMKPSQFTYTNKALKKINDIRRDILTTYSPTFALTNPIKDVQDILLNSQHPARTYATIPEAIYSVISKNHWYQERMDNGGNQDSYFDGQTKTFKKEGGWFKKAMGFVPSKIQAANEIIEQVPRMAEYIASRKMGRSIDVSMLDAARVTTNFGAPGDLTNMLNRNGFTFLGASVEGFNQQVRNVREAKAEGLKGVVKLAAKYLVAGLPVLLLNHAFWDDDEEYEELSDYVKQNYYIVGKTEDGKFVRIPKGRAVSVIQDAFNQMENLITGNDDVDLESFGQLVVNNLAPNNPLENNLIAPIVQATTNKTWYGDDLVPTRLQDVPVAEQFDETTDSISKWLGEATNTSPYKWNYLLDQYTGGVGDMVLPYLTTEADGGGLGAAFRDKFVTDPVLKNQNVTDFYDKVDELTVNANSSKATDEDILMSKYMSYVSSEMGKLYQQKREIQNNIIPEGTEYDHLRELYKNKTIPDDVKYAEVRAIQQQIDDLAREGLATYEDVDIDNGYATIGDLHYRWYEPGEDSNAEPGWQKITDKQLKKQEEVTSALGIDGSEYWSNKEEYDFAYESPEKYAVAKAVGGYTAYKTYARELYDIKADKDSSGKTISGSRKEKVLDYINNLDADYGEKLILFKSEYNADDTYNYEIIDYLNSRDDIDYEEMETILKELGFDVSSDGTITWD